MSLEGGQGRLVALDKQELASSLPHPGFPGPPGVTASPMQHPTPSQQKPGTGSVTRGVISQLSGGGE